MCAVRTARARALRFCARAAPPEMSFTTRTSWRWIGKSRRHDFRFEHNAMTGEQRVFVDDAEVFGSGWKFRLTGSIYLPIDDALVELYIKSDGAAGEGGGAREGGGRR